MSRALILAYHSISDGPPPLCLSPALLAEHLDRIADAGAATLTVTELARRLRAGTLPERAVALTFDDGYRDFADAAVPLLAERRMTATVFCIGGWLGRDADWPTLPERAPRLPLMDAAALRDVAAAGIEVGAHGLEHSPLHDASPAAARRELVDGRRALEEAAGVKVTSLAFPYAAPPSPAARAIVASEYEAACAGGLRPVPQDADPHALPRIDAHYLRRPALLAAALRGADPYLALRRAGSRVRRRFVRDYAA